jgi:hypothetical protein
MDSVAFLHIRMLGESVFDKRDRLFSVQKYLADKADLTYDKKRHHTTN